MSLHAEYTNRRTIIEQFAEKVRERGLRAHIHLSETKKEHEECKAKYSLTPTQLFYKCGVFDVPTTAAIVFGLRTEILSFYAKRA